MYRSLQDNELAAYYDFLTDVFSFKPAPRSLFVRHVETDPYMDLKTIYVAEDVSHGNRFAGTARTFKRELIAQAEGGQRMEFGGIGEGGSLYNGHVYVLWMACQKTRRIVTRQNSPSMLNRRMTPISGHIRSIPRQRPSYAPPCTQCEGHASPSRTRVVSACFPRRPS